MGISNCVKHCEKISNAANSLGKKTHLASFNEVFSGISMEIRKLVFCKMAD